MDWDTDNDGLPDKFEYDNSSRGTDPLDPNDNSDAPLDFDSDLNPNLHEYWNGTDPWTAAPLDHVSHVNFGCAYWGEGDGDAFTGPGDMNNLQALILGGSTDYSNVIPRSWQVQDLDRDGFPGPGDLSILQSMILESSLPSIDSRAAELVLFDSPSSPVADGFTCHVTIGVLGEHVAGDRYVSGFGVVFTVSSGSATLLGGDGSDSGGRYDYSGPFDPFTPARIVIRIDSPGTIEIDAQVPACGTLGTVPVFRARPVGLDALRHVEK